MSQVSRAALAGMLVLSACAKSTPLFHDYGTPAANPYDPLANPRYTEGSLSGFDRLYVNPAAFTTSLEPSGPAPSLPEVFPASEGVPLGELVPGVGIRVDREKLDPTGLQVKDLFAPVLAQAGGAANWIPTDNLIAVRAADAAAATKLADTLRATAIGDAKAKLTLGSVATVEALTAPPAFSEALIRVLGGPEIAGITTWMPRPKSAQNHPPRGDLAIDNPTTAWAEVAISGQKVGRVPPLGEASVRDVKYGTYEVSLTQPNGHVWNRKVVTQASAK